MKSKIFFNQKALIWFLEFGIWFLVLALSAGSYRGGVVGCWFLE